MARSFLRLMRIRLRRRRLDGVPFVGNDHLMRDIGCVPKQEIPVDFTYSLPPR